MSPDDPNSDAGGEVSADVSPDVGVVLAAAGAGRRFGARKQLLSLAGRPLVLHSLDLFRSIADVGEIVVVVAAADVESCRRLVEREDSVGVRVVEGGDERQDSVLSGVRSLGEACEFVLVHDAARPLIERRDVVALIAAVREAGAAVLGYPAVDSVKEESAGSIRRGLARERVWLVQTPQGARLETLRTALEDAAAARFAGTDEASILERAGQAVKLIEGSRDNIKVTFPQDLELAEFLVAKRARERPE